MASRGASLAEVAERIRSAKTLVVTAHVNPDPDAVGSSCGLAKAIQGMGKTVQAYFVDGIPPRLTFLSAGVSVITEPPKNEFDLLLVLDTATKMRVGDQVDKLMAMARETINIDHHYSNDDWAAVNHIDSGSASSAEIAFELTKELGASLDKESATSLLAGLMDDTGCFRFSNTNQQALLRAAELVGAGANPSSIANQVYFSEPPHKLAMRAAVIDSLQLFLDDRLAITILDKETMKRLNASADDTEGMIDEARSIRGVLGAVFLLETDEYFKGSLRSKIEGLDVSAIAQRFGGGGHKMAAGFRTRKSKKDLIDTLVAEFATAFKGLSKA